MKCNSKWMIHYDYYTFVLSFTSRSCQHLTLHRYVHFTDAHIFLAASASVKYDSFPAVIYESIDRDSWEKCPERAGDGAFCVGGSHGDTLWQEQKGKRRESEKKRTRKNHAESSVMLKSICHHIVLTHQDRCSLNAILSETDTHTTKQTNHYTDPASREKWYKSCLFPALKKDFLMSLYVVEMRSQVAC